MSATMHLWKPLDVKFLGSPYDDYTDKQLSEHGEEIDEKLGCPIDGSLEDIDIWGITMNCSEWEDKQGHDMLDLTYIKSIFKAYNDKAWRRVRKKLSQFPSSVGHRKVTSRKVICADEMAYAQGWFFKRRFFKKKTTFVFCTTKKEMELFFKRYMDNSEDSRKAQKYFLEKWEDGFIFECAW